MTKSCQDRTNEAVPAALFYSAPGAFYADRQYRNVEVASDTVRLCKTADIFRQQAFLSPVSDTN